MLVFVMVLGASLSVEESLKIGPWGGEGGTKWSFKPSQGGSMNDIEIRHGRWAISSISVKTVEGVGTVEYSKRFGCDVGLKDKIVLGEDHYLTSISGTFGKRWNLFGPVDKSMIMVVPREPGPRGGLGGKQWDDGVFTEIHELHLEYGDSAIHSLQIMYETKEGKRDWSHRHGGPGGDRTYKENKN
ncbi:Agglutinin [Morella rubra]|uniref:Agglutinin n=1 Tax=Morella rubra TaxID=262757 RepID=A0A6A1W5T9_9ROSI|nr:Agglutinin [Morella rubra]